MRVLLAFFVSIVLVYCIIHGCRYMGKRYVEKVKMDFDQWLDIYRLKPERWYVPSMGFDDLNYPVYVDELYLRNGCVDYCYCHHVCFGLIGDMRYRRWAIKTKKQVDKTRRSEYGDRVLINILDNAQLDIDEMRTKAQQEIDEARERIMKGVQDAGNLH